MKARQIISLLKKLALLAALAAHLVLPAAASAAPGLDPGSMLCAPSGKVSPEAEAAIQAMLRLAGADKEEDPPAKASHCGACVMMGAALATHPFLSLAAIAADHGVAPPRAGRLSPPSVHGPPLGLRAPPFSP